MGMPRSAPTRLNPGTLASISGQSLMDPGRADKLLRRWSWQGDAAPAAHPHLRLQRKT